MVEIDTKTAKKTIPFGAHIPIGVPPPPHPSELQRDRLLLQHHVTPAVGVLPVMVHTGRLRPERGTFLRLSYHIKG